MQVIGWHRPGPAPAAGAGFVRFTDDLGEAIRRADFVSVHLAATAATRHLIDQDRLALFQPHAWLINTARGAVVDEQALIAALTSRRIAGAGLDVFTDEPDVPALLAELDNVVLTPHIGSATVETRTRMAVMAASNLVAVLKGEPPLNPVNPEARRGDA
jgi:phosphoglycerate dehydrogenase-like enzyme